ncbi:hypothetical protein SAMN05446635_0782 [Burkholderia sp. OK233]|nr:hypothetical protein SAMN05446635_0782 [Burkholderia sp. OK233]
MDMHWTIYLQRDGADEKVPLARFQRPPGFGANTTRLRATHHGCRDKSKISAASTHFSPGGVHGVGA